MGKVIIFNGSPRKKGTTAALLDEIAAGARASGAEVVEYDLNDTGLRGCQGCRACRKEDAEACIQNDYFKPMYKELKEAVGIVLGAPIYMGTVTAQAWVLINRLYPAIDHNHAPRFPGKKFAVVTTQGNPDANLFRAGVEAVQGFLKRLGWELVGDIGWASAGGEPSDELKKQAFEAGQRLV